MVRILSPTSISCTRGLVEIPQLLPTKRAVQRLLQSKGSEDAMEEGLPHRTSVAGRQKIKAVLASSTLAEISALGLLSCFA